MRLLTVALFSVILYHCYVDSLNIPVNLATGPKTIPSDSDTHCKQQTFEAAGRMNTDDSAYNNGGGESCNVGSNNRGILTTDDQVTVQEVGFCKGRVLKCDYDASNANFCSGKTDIVQLNNENKLEANKLVFTDSNLCYLEISDHNDEASLINRYQQECFKDFTTDASRLLHVQTVANYRPSSRELALTSDRLLMGDTFGFATKISHECGYGICGYGAHMTMTTVKNAIFSIEFHPKPTCSWIAFCFEYAEMCKERHRIMLLLDHNIVLPHTMNTAITMNLRDAKTIKIERRAGDVLKQFITITTDTLDRIVLDAVNHGTKFAVMMSDNECLAAPIFSTLGKISIVETDDPKDKITELYTNKDTTGTDKLDTVKMKAEIDANKNHNATQITVVAEIVTEFAEPSEETESIMDGTAGLATTEATYAPPDLGSLKQINTDNGDTSTKAKNRGWLTWGYFYGALAGSTTGLIIIGVIFFFARRSIYGDWYRGMYKRYGCDASGTTGGVTGADFGATTGGNTTIGATTAGATATSATTGGDTTSNSAMSGTSGATSGEKTGGSTMITM